MLPVSINVSLSFFACSLKIKRAFIWCAAKERRKGDFMKEILIFVGGSMFGSLVLFFALCLLGGFQSGDEIKYKGEDTEESADV